MRPGGDQVFFVPKTPEIKVVPCLSFFCIVSGIWVVSITGQLGKLAPPRDEGKDEARDMHDLANLIVLPVLLIVDANYLVTDANKAANSN